MKRRLVMAGAVLALAPGVARACAVCGADGGASRSAFFWTTVLLSLVPLALFGGGLLFLRRAAGEWMRDELADPDAPVPADATAPGDRDRAPAATRLVPDAR